MFQKNVFVIDDAGDLFEALSIGFNENIEINVKQSKSNINFLKNSLKRDTSLILINADGLESDLLKLVKYINQVLFYLTVPIMIASSDKELVKSKPILEVPIISYFLKPFDLQNLTAGIEYLLEIFEYNKNINDISGLPGSNIINKKLVSQISKGSKFAFVFLDLDNFKEFGEYYGLYKASEVLSFLSDLLSETISNHGSIDDFIGHVGGDDFIMILEDYKIAETVCREIINGFDEKISEFYEDKDLKNGYIETVNRSGELERIKVMGISVVILNYVDFKNNSFDDAYKKLMNLKKEAKLVDGSVLLNGS